MSKEPLTAGEMTLLGVCVAAVLGMLLVFGALASRIFTGTF